MRHFKKVVYGQLNARQKEVHNFHLVCALLAQHGYASYLVRDDWSGADFVARHMLSGEMLAVQLKPRVVFDKKYQNKEIWIAFRDGSAAYVYPHDRILAAYLETNSMTTNRSWQRDGSVSWSRITRDLRSLLSGFRLE